MWLLPPNPGPFGSLEQWLQWRQELLRLGAQTHGVDVELAVANKMIGELQEAPPGPPTFEPLSDQEHSAIARARPTDRGPVVDSILPHRDEAGAGAPS